MKVFAVVIATFATSTAYMAVDLPSDILGANAVAAEPIDSRSDIARCSMMFAAVLARVS